MAAEKLSAQFEKALRKISSSAAVADVTRYFHVDTNSRSKGNKILGVSIGKIFPIAKKHVGMSLAEIEALLESPYYEIRMGATAIMDFQARAKNITPEHRKALYSLYINRHDRINNWDLVDRAAPYVVGGYLIDKPRAPLKKLAKSANPWERRTAIVSTYFFIRAGETEETFRIAELLVKDKHELVQKAVGSWIREAGKKDLPRLLAFLSKHAATMPRTTLRYAVEKLSAAQRQKYLAAGK